MTGDKPADGDGTLIEEQEDQVVPLRERYGLVLGLILVAYLLGGFDESKLIFVINTLVWGTVLLAALWSPGLPKWLRRIGVIGVVVFTVTAVTMAFTLQEQAHGWRLMMLAATQFAAILAILIRIAQHSVVTAQTVMGGVAAYAMIAFSMATLYHSFDLLLEPVFLNGVKSAGDYVYFSFVTMTTVGYGDISPATDLAKRLVVVEMFVGQVFIITLVARLVSLWGRPTGRGRQ